MSTGFQQLDGLLGPVLPLLSQRDVIEISVNPDGTGFVERFGSGKAREFALAGNVVQAIIQFCATAAGTTVTQSSPIFSGTIPGTRCRIEGLLRPVVAAPSMSIRRATESVKSIEDFTSTEDQRARLRAALRDRENIVISGGTGSGKTSFANALLKELGEIEPDSRIILIEDTAELRAPHENTTALLTSDQVDQRRLLVSTLRLAPDRIMLGECRDGAAALTLLKTWNTGHPGGITTVHANSACEAVSRLAALCSEVSLTDQTPMIRQTVGLIVQIERHSSAPAIVELHAPTERDST